MANAQGEKVSLTPGTWIGLIGLSAVMLGATATMYERIIRMEVNSETTTAAVKEMLGDMRELHDRLAKLEAGK